MKGRAGLISVSGADCGWRRSRCARPGPRRLAWNGVEIYAREKSKRADVCSRCSQVKFCPRRADIPGRSATGMNVQAPPLPASSAARKRRVRSAWEFLERCCIRARTRLPWAWAGMDQGTLARRCTLAPRRCGARAGEGRELRSTKSGNRTRTHLSRQPAIPRCVTHVLGRKYHRCA